MHGQHRSGWHGPALTLLLALPALVPYAFPNAATRNESQNHIDQDPSSDLAKGHFALRYSQSLGEVEKPYAPSPNQLNHPTGITVAGDALWVAEGAGRRALRFTTSGSFEVQLGRAGLAQGIDGLDLGFLSDLIADESGHLWLADAERAWVTKLDSTGTPAMLLGESGRRGKQHGQFFTPASIALDSAGNIYVSDGAPPTVSGGNHRIEIFDSEGQYLATIGETGVAGSGNAHLDSPRQIAIDTSDRLYVADSGNHRIQVFDVSSPSAPVHLATYGGPVAGDDETHFDQPSGIAVDQTFVYVADSANCRVQVLQRSNGRLWRSLAGICGDDGDALRWPVDVAVDSNGHIHVVDHLGMRIVTYDNRYTWLRQHGAPGVPYLGARNELQLNGPAGLARTADGGNLVVEADGHRLVKVNALGLVDWTIGSAGRPGTEEGRFSGPSDVSVAEDGRIFVADTGNRRIQVFDAGGLLLDTIVHVGAAGEPLGCPESVTVAPGPMLLVADPCRHVVWQTGLDGSPQGHLGQVDRPGVSDTELDSPSGVASDAQGQVYVADTGNHRVLVFDERGRKVGQIGDGSPGQDFAHFDRPHRVEVDSLGRIHMADLGNERIQVYAPDGSYLTSIGGLAGPGRAQLRSPSGMAFDSSGGLWVADRDNHRLQRFVTGVPGWRQGNVNGFGHPDRAAVGSLLGNDAALYAGLRFDDRPAALWRMSDKAEWSMIMADGFGSATNRGISRLTTYRGDLYAATENPDQGTELWRSADGEQWASVAMGGFGTEANHAILGLAEIGGQLCAGTEVEASRGDAEIWCSPDGAQGSWSRSVTAGEPGMPGSDGFTSFANLGDGHFVGTLGSPTGGGVWRSEDGLTWQAITEPGFGASYTTGVTSLAVYSETLYAVTSTDPHAGRGAEVWRCSLCEGDDWSRVAQAGVGQASLPGPADLEVFQETEGFAYLYLSIGGPDGMEVWRSSDGENWETMARGGLGDSLNAQPAGDGILTRFGDRLFVATRNPGHGAEIWSTAGTRLDDPLYASVPELVPPRRAVGGPIRYTKSHQFPGTWPPPEGTVEDDAIGHVAVMAVADDGTVFLLDSLVGRIVKLNPDGSWGRPIGDRGPEAERIAFATDMAIDSDAEHIYVSDPGAGRVAVFDFDGRWVDEWPGLMVERLEIDPDTKEIWLWERGGSAYSIRDGSGVELRSGHFSQHQRFREFAVGPRGSLFYFLSPYLGWQGEVWIPNNRRSYYDWNGDPDTVRLVALSEGTVAVNGDTLGRVEHGSIARTSSRYDITDILTVGFNHNTGELFALGIQDVDEDDDRNPTTPVVIRYKPDDYRLMVEVWPARHIPEIVTDRLADPSRISTTPDEMLSLSDDTGVSVWPRDGSGQLQLGTEFHDVRDNALYYPEFSIGEGRNQRLMLLAQRDVGNSRIFVRQQVVAYGDTLDERVCRDGLCLGELKISPLWRTIQFTQRGLPRTRPLTNYVRAVAHEPTRPQLLVLRSYPTDTGGVLRDIVVTSLPLGEGGRRYDTRLGGMPIDIDASPDGRVYVLDAVGPSALVFNRDLEPLVRIPVPADAFKIAAGSGGRYYVLTRGGQIVRVDPDGSVRARFDARPRFDVPLTAIKDLAVDANDHVYVVDQHTDQVTVFRPEDFELGGDPTHPCTIIQSKAAQPADFPLGDQTQVELRLEGACGPYGEPADIIIAIDTQGGRALNQLETAKLLLQLIDLDRHRVATIAYYGEARLLSPLTRNRQALLDSLSNLDVPGRASNVYHAFQLAQGQFADRSSRHRVVILVNPWFSRTDQFAGLAMDLSRQMRNEGTVIIAVDAEGPPIPPPAPGRPPLPEVTLIADHLLSFLTWNVDAFISLTELIAPHAEPSALIRHGQITDIIPSNMQLVTGSPKPPAAWDPIERTLTWTISNTLPARPVTFTYSLVPKQAGRWPTNVEASVDFEDGVGSHQKLVFPVPEVRVYGFDTPTPTPSLTPTPTATAMPTPPPVPRPVFLPLLLHEHCEPGEQHADIVLAIDTSSSMTGEPLAAAKKAALAFLDNLDFSGDQVALVSFDSEARLEIPLSVDPQAVAKAIAVLSPRQGTRIAVGLQIAVQELAGQRRLQDNEAVIVLLTDGVGEAIDQAETIAADARATGVRIFTVGLGTEVDAAVLERIAGDPNRAYLAPSLDDLTDIYLQVAGAIPCPPEIYWGRR